MCKEQSFAVEVFQKKIQCLFTDCFGFRGSLPLFELWFKVTINEV